MGGKGEGASKANRGRKQTNRASPRDINYGGGQSRDQHTVYFDQFPSGSVQYYGGGGGGGTLT